MPGPRHLAAIALPLLLLPLLPGELSADPLPDVPRDHPAAVSVARLWRAGIIRGDSHGRFEGDRRLTEDEAVCLAARLAAAANAEATRADLGGVEQFLNRWWEHGETALADCPYPRNHWAVREWAYLRQVRPYDVDVLDGWPDPLPTRYEAAMAAAEVLRQVREASRSDLVSDLDRDMGAIGETCDMLPPDWMPPTGHEDDGGGEGAAMEPEPMPLPEMPGEQPQGEAPAS